MYDKQYMQQSFICDTYQPLYSCIILDCDRILILSPRQASVILQVLLIIHS